MKKILVTAYAVNPYKGSEDGMGWHFIRQIARHHKVLAITRENNRDAIEHYMQEVPDDLYPHIQFHYFDLPYWMRFWKRKQRGALLYFYLWQFFMPFFVRKQGLVFDIAHNLNFHNDWTPTFLWRLKKPLVWGPVGHHPRIPSGFLPRAQRLKNGLVWLAKKIFWLADPYLKKSRKKARVILSMNTAVSKNLAAYTSKLFLMPSVGTVAPKIEEKTDSVFRILFVGRFVGLKGVNVVLDAFGLFYHQLSDAMQEKVELTMIGTGPMQEQMQQIIEDNQLSDCVNLIPWMDKKNLATFYSNADLFFFPSHEGAGMVVAEALSFGLPVLCYDNAGPGELAGREAAVLIPDNLDYLNSVELFSDILTELLHKPEKRKLMSKKALQRFQDYLHWDRKGDALKDIYDQV